jgi:predicted nucleotidyltransferase
VENISLYGSFARGEETKENDIDFIVEMPPSFHEICALEEYLEKKFKRKVDIIRRHLNLRKGFVEEIQKDTISV